MQLVAPAGSFSALRAAVNSGADAVYLGMPQFGARAKAENFDAETLKSAIDFAHLFGTKVFVTLNTLIKDSELSRALDLAHIACESGADAAIVQDLRFIKLLKRELPNFVLHASTQMGIHNKYGAQAVLDLGISRAVLSRETLPDDIPKIKSTGIDIEFFVQGALCVCFSGNCYFSSLASSYSGNRGKCMQLCRKPFFFGGEKGYFLSAKDLFLYDKLRLLESLGVDAIKIEGRMRSDEYVSQAVRTYKSHISSDKAREALKAVFNRGNYCSAYLDGDAPFRAVYSKSQANIGRLIGKIDGVKKKNIKVSGFSPDGGDGFKITRNGCEIGGAAVINGEIIADCDCKTGDELNRTFDGKLSRELSEIKRKIDVSVDVRISKCDIPRVVVSDGKANYTVFGENIPQAALKREINADDVTRAFEKVGETPFRATVSAKVDEGLFLPVSSLNELRRKAYDAAIRGRLDGYEISKSTTAYRGIEYKEFLGRGIILMVDGFDVLDDEILSSIDYVAINPRDYGKIEVRKINKPVLLNMPVTMRGNDENILRRAVDLPIFDGIISNNLYTLKLTDKPILLGTGHNIIGKCDLPHIGSFESDAESNSWTYVYGYAPIMTLCHCPYGKCVDCNGDDVLTDESGRKFAMRKYTLAHCYWQLLNCVPHNLVSSVRDRKFYDCTGHDKKAIKRVLAGDLGSAYTRGNTNKGLK